MSVIILQAFSTSCSWSFLFFFSALQLVTPVLLKPQCSWHVSFHPALLVHTRPSAASCVPLQWAMPQGWLATTALQQQRSKTHPAWSAWWGEWSYGTAGMFLVVSAYSSKSYSLARGIIVTIITEVFWHMFLKLLKNLHGMYYLF